MASAYGILRQYGTYVSPYNFDLIQQGLAYKQQRFDANAAKIQGLVDKFSSLQLARDVDKKYLNQRMQGLLDQVNSLGGVDLSKNNVTSKITGHINKVLDDKVMTAYQGTQNLSKLQKEINDVRTKNNKAYSSQNHAYALRGAEKWLAGEEAGESYGGGTYIHYEDVRGDMNKIMRDLAKSKGTQKVSFPDPDNPGYQITKEIKQLNADEIRTVALNSLNANQRKQLEIDGWANYKDSDPQVLEASLAQYGSGMNTKYDAIISGLEVKKSKAKTDEKKQMFDAQINMYNQRKTDLADKLEAYKGNKDAMGAFLEQERLVNGLIATHQFKESSEIYSVDDAYWKQKEYNYKVYNDQRNYNLNQRKQLFAERKYSDELAEKKKAEEAAKRVSQTTREGTETPDREPVVTEAYAKIENAKKTSDNLAVRIVEAKSSEDEAIKTAWEAFKEDAKVKHPSAKEADMAHKFIETHKLRTPEYARARGDENSLLKATEKAMRDTFAKSDKVYEDIFNVMFKGDMLISGVNTLLGKNVIPTNISIKKTWEHSGRAGNEVTGTYQEYLKDKEINSFEDLQKNSELYKEFKQDITGDIFLSNLGYGWTNERDRKSSDLFKTSRGLITSTNDYSKKDLHEMKMHFASFAQASGSNVTFDDIFAVKEQTGWFSSWDGATQEVSVKENLSGEAQELYDRLNGKWRKSEFDVEANPFLGDSSFQDMADVREIFQADKLGKRYEDLLEKNVSELAPRELVYTFTDNNTGYEELKNIVGSQFEFTGNPNIEITTEGGKYKVGIPEKTDKKGETTPARYVNISNPNTELPLEILEQFDFSGQPQYSTAHEFTYNHPTMNFFKEGDVQGYTAALKAKKISKTDADAALLTEKGFKASLNNALQRRLNKDEDRYVQSVLDNSDEFNISFHSDPDAQMWYNTVTPSDPNKTGFKYDFPLFNKPFVKQGEIDKVLNSSEKVLFMLVAKSLRQDGAGERLKNEIQKVIPPSNQQ